METTKVHAQIPAIKWLLFYMHLIFVAKSQGTYYSDLPDRSWFDLEIAEDGRIQAYLKGGLYYDEDKIDSYSQVFRNFIEINKDTGTLLIAFGVAVDNFRVEGQIMTLKLESQGLRTGPPREATKPRNEWFHDNMIIWYVPAEKAHVMIYQEGCYSCWSSIDSDWLSNHDLDAMNQTLWKTVTYDDGETWSERVKILGSVVDPHVHFQIIPGLDLDDNGFSKEVLIPVHHLDESETKGNFQMIWRCNRAIDPDDGSWMVVNMSNSSDLNIFGGYIQASIVRPNNDKLVAFLRDRNGWWMGRSVSTDDGRSWSEVEEMPLPNADLMSQAIWLHSGKVMLIYNPQQSFGSGYDPGDRIDNAHILVVALSDDEGLTWLHARTLEYAYDAMHLYPVGLQDPTCDNVYLTYSMETNEPRVTCSALSGDEYDTCMEKRITINFIKFTILHESWVLDSHNWAYDFSGCTWEISPELRAKIPISLELRDLSSLFYARLTNSSSRGIMYVLIVLISVAAMCTCGIFLYRISAFVRLSHIKVGENDHVPIG